MRHLFQSRAVFGFLLIALLTGVSRRLFAIDKVTPAHVVYQSEEGFYIDAGENVKINNGDIGVVRKQGVDIAVVRVVQVGRRSSFVEIITVLQQTSLKAGDPVFFESRVQNLDVPDEKGKVLDRVIIGNELETAPTPENEFKKGTPDPRPSTTTLKTAQNKEDEFVPLLALPPVKRIAVAREKNIFHGRLRARQIYQTIHNDHTDDWASRLDSDGSIDRIQGSLWSMLWSGNVSYRAGDSFVTATDYHDPQLHVYRFMTHRKLEEGGFDSLGRILPVQLPGMGYIDGGHFERILSSSWRFGGMAGAKPDRRDLGLSGRELVSGIYTSLDMGDPAGYSYSSTWGLMQTLFVGQADELGLLWDQRATITPKLNLVSTAQLDMDEGQGRSGRFFRVPRGDLYMNAPVLSDLSFRAGFSHFERPDTAAERDMSGGDATSILDSSYWRYWLGSNQNLPWSLQLDEELGFTRTHETYSQGMWRLSLSRSGLWLIPQGSLTVSMYNLDTFEGDGYGFTCSGIAPLFQNRLDITANGGFRYKSIDGSGKKLKTNDYSVHVDWHLSRVWDLTAGISRVFQDNITSTVADTSASYRW